MDYNHPNPFNPVVRIRYEIPKMGNVIIQVFDILGKELTNLVKKKNLWVLMKLSSTGSAKKTLVEFTAII